MEVGKCLSGHYLEIWHSMTVVEQKELEADCKGCTSAEIAFLFERIIDEIRLEYAAMEAKQAPTMTGKQLFDFLEEQKALSIKNGGVAITPISATDARSIFESWDLMDEQVGNFIFLDE